MLNQLQHIILRDAFVQVVGMHFEENVTRYHCVKVTFKENELNVVEQKTYKTEEALLEGLNKNKPVLLSFTGKGVLHKKVKKTPDYRSKILLNVTTDDFYFYELIQDKEVFVAVIRKNQVNPVFEKFATNGFIVIDYSIGDLISQLVSSFISEGELQSHDIVLKTKGDGLEEFYSVQKESKSILIGDQKLSSDTIVLFATALNHFSPFDYVVYDTEFLRGNKEEKKFKRFFDVLGVFVLGFFLISLVGSYLLLGYFNEKIVETNTSLSLVQESYERVKELEAEREEKRKILEESGVMTASFLSYYCNEITYNIPKTITLSSLYVFPTTKKIKQGEKVLFEAQKISVSGVSVSNKQFNDWYKGLKQFKWIKSIDIVHYGANKENKYDFEIQLMIQ